MPILSVRCPSMFMSLPCVYVLIQLRVSCARFQLPVRPGAAGGARHDLHVAAAERSV